MKNIQIFIFAAALLATFQLDGAESSETKEEALREKKSRVGRDYLDLDSSRSSEDDLPDEHEDASASHLQSLTDNPENTRGLLDFFSKKKKKQGSEFEHDQSDIVEAHSSQLREEVAELNGLLEHVHGIMLNDARAQDINELIARFERAVLCCIGRIDLANDMSPYFNVSGKYHQVSDTVEILVDRTSGFFGRWEHEGSLRITEDEAQQLLARLVPAIHSRLGGHRIQWKILGLEGTQQEMEKTLKKIIDRVLNEKYKTGAFLRQLQEPHPTSTRASHEIGTFTLTTRLFSLWDHLLGQLIHKGKLVSLRDGRPISLRLLPHACVAQLILIMTLWAAYDVREYALAPAVILVAGLVFVYRYLKWVPKEPVII